jgi:hypothetical protein
VSFAISAWVALRMRLDEICRQELDSFRQENGPFSKNQDEMLNAVMSRMTRRIAGSLARELKELPEKLEQEQMTTAFAAALPPPDARDGACRHQILNAIAKLIAPVTDWHRNQPARKRATRSSCYACRSTHKRVRQVTYSVHGIDDDSVYI